MFFCFFILLLIFSQDIKIIVRQDSIFMHPFKKKIRCLKKNFALIFHFHLLIFHAFLNFEIKKGEDHERERRTRGEELLGMRESYSLWQQKG